MNIRPMHVRVAPLRAIDVVVRHVMIVHVRAMYDCCNRATIPYLHH
jgi:hypothetical protein